MKKIKFNKNTFFYLFGIFYIAIFVKILQYKILPAKYFYDSKHILAIMFGSLNYDKTYLLTANIFNKINFFHFSNIQQWSILLSCIFNPIIFFELMKEKKYNSLEYIFIYSSVILLNMYVFNLSKDIIQFIVFYIIYLILICRIKSDKKKVFLIALVCWIEAFMYRIYFGIMGALVIALFYLYNIFGSKKRCEFKIICMTLIVFFMGVFILSKISSENYETLLNARYSVNIQRSKDIDAVTIIKEPFGKNTNFFKFIMNYLTDFVRMAVPLELIFKGIKYTPFVIYQMYISYSICKLIRKNQKENILIIATFLSYFMVSVIFEPDFGSFIRHESAATLIIVNFIKKSNNKECKKF